MSAPGCHSATAPAPASAATAGAITDCVVRVEVCRVASLVHREVHEQCASPQHEPAPIRGRCGRRPRVEAEAADEADDGEGQKPGDLTAQLGVEHSQQPLAAAEGGRATRGACRGNATGARKPRQAVVAEDEIELGVGRYSRRCTDERPSATASTIDYPPGARDEQSRGPPTRAARCAGPGAAYRTTGRPEREPAPR